MSVSGTGLIDVCIVTKRFHPIMSGAAERFRRYAPGLRERGVSLRVSTLQKLGTSAFDVVDGIEVNRVLIEQDHGSLSTALFKSTLRHCRESRQWPDVFHFLNHSLSGNPYVWEARLHRVPCVMSQTMMSARPMALRPRVKAQIAQWLLLQPWNCIVANSWAMAQKLAREGISPQRIETIPNGVDLQRFRPAHSTGERDMLRGQLKMEADDEVIVFVGNISRRKGVDLLIAAWPEIIQRRPRARLFIVGPRETGLNQGAAGICSASAFLEEFDKAVKRLPAAERVVLTGTVSDVERYLQAADVFAFPSRKEGMPNALLEAMSAALPCVITPFDGLSTEFGRTGGQFLAVPREPCALAGALVELLENKSLSRSLGQSARCQMSRHMGLDVCLDRYAELYQRLIQASKVRARHSTTLPGARCR